MIANGKYADYKFQPNWKKDDKIICIQNAGKSQLIPGKEYRVIEAYHEYGADEVLIVPIDNDDHPIRCFSSRFTTLKRQRKEKLEKIKIKI